jgi:DNA-binding NarL/FixJ family response regulator
MKLSDELKGVLELVSLGKTNEEISVELNYSTRTVERRISNLLKIYQVKNRILLAQEYLKEQLV